MHIQKDKNKMKVKMEDIRHDIGKKQKEQYPDLFKKETIAVEKINISEVKSNMELNKEKELIAAKEYNSNLHKVVKQYASFRPIGGLVVRAFVKEPISIGSIVIPFLDIIPIRTNNGQGVLREIKNPYNYDRKGIIVAIPDEERFFKVGDVVLIPETGVIAPIPGSEHLEVSNKLLLPPYNQSQPPTDMTDENYGYLFLSHGQIKGWLDEKREIEVI